MHPKSQVSVVAHIKLAVFYTSRYERRRTYGKKGIIKAHALVNIMSLTG
jgi:hypothetical protein